MGKAIDNILDDIKREIEETALAEKGMGEDKRKPEPEKEESGGKAKETTEYAKCVLDCLWHGEKPPSRRAFRLLGDLGY